MNKMNETQSSTVLNDELNGAIVPPNRSLFGLCGDAHNIYIFGGQTQSSKESGSNKMNTFLNDLWMMNGMY